MLLIRSRFFGTAFQLEIDSLSLGDLLNDAAEVAINPLPDWLLTGTCVVKAYGGDCFFFLSR